MSSPKGKYVGNIDPDSPQALGICDYTGFVFPKKDLIKQMEWRGNALVWTGFLVGKPFLDKPNDQLRPPVLPPDPVPVELPRLQQPSSVTWSNQTITWSLLPVYDWISWSGSEDGIPVATEAQRLAALQLGQAVQQQSYGNAGSEARAPELTQQNILNNLNNFYWNPA